MLDDFLVRALLAGLGVAVVAGPLGCFVVWRRMAYFGDSLGHGALLGVALGFLLGLDLNLGVLATSLAIAATLALLERQRRLPVDTLLGILSQTALSLGLVALSLATTARVDLLGYLFGDILAVAPPDLIWIWGGATIVLAGLAALWRPLLAVTVHADIAQVEGVAVGVTRLAFTLLIAVVVATAMKIVGVLLITSLLILPAAAARRLARTPEEMAIGAGLLGSLAVTAGIYGSFRLDLPSGPAIVLAAAALLVLTSIVGAMRRPKPVREPELG